MESLYLKTFLEVVRAGSISRAADILCVTQPAVSRRIKFMEDQYGFPLLDRTAQHLKLTEAGQIVLEKAEKLLEIESELLVGLRSLSQKIHISFCCSPAFGITHLPGILKEFMLDHAETAELQFIFSKPEEIVQGTQEGLFDLALIEHCNAIDLTEFCTYPLPGDAMVFASAPELCLPTPELALDDLLDVPLFVRKEGCCSRILMEENLRRIGRELREFKKVIVYDDLHVIIRSVLDGDGIAFIPQDLFIDHLQKGLLHQHTLPGFIHHRNRTLLMRDKRPETTKPLREFIDTIFRHFDLTSPL